MSDRVRAYYRDNPLMVSSPFGGVDSINRALIHDVFARLGIDVAGKDVLDVGCGRGMMGRIVSELGGRYTGVDFVRPGEGGPDALADAQRLPFGDGAFDVVLCVDVFEHLPDERAAVVEFRRVLRPDGVVFLSTPNYANVAGLVKRWCETRGSYEKDTWAPFRNWQPQELERPLTPRIVHEAFRQAGFGASRCIGHAPEVGLGLFPWLEHPRTPEFLKFRLQRIFATIGLVVVRAWPGASLHTFWRIEG